MLNLYLLRHGKAANAKTNQSDYDRPLNKKGIVQINQIGYILGQSSKKIEQIISSSAQRTKETSEITNNYLNLPNISYHDDLYLAQHIDIISKISDLATEKSVLYVGHNFGISDLVSYLVGDIYSMTTGMLIEIEFEFDDWKMISSSSGSLKNIQQPRIYIP